MARVPGAFWVAVGVLTQLTIGGVLGTDITHAGSPDPGTGMASPAPSAGPSPWPTIPIPEGPAPAPAPPEGAPSASTTDHGIRLELWFSPTVANPGGWVQAVVRVTNVGERPARNDLGICGAGITRVGFDLGPSTPQGIEQSGNAARYKRSAIVADRDAQGGQFVPYEWIGQGMGQPSVRALAECTTPFGPPEFRLLPPGASRVERYAWFPARIPLASSGRVMQPLFPGPVPVTARWSYGGRGGRPTAAQLRRRPGDPGDRAVDRGRRWTRHPVVPAARGHRARRHRLPRVGRCRTARCHVAGAGHGSPARDPRVPGLRGWDLVDGDPRGAMELLLGWRVADPSDAGGRPRDRRGAIYLDPWTGEVLGHWFNVAWPPTADASAGPSVSPAP